MLGIRGQHYRPHDVSSRRSVPRCFLIGEVTQSSSWSFRARFLRHQQIEDDDDQALRASSPSNCSRRRGRFSRSFLRRRQIEDDDDTSTISHPRPLTPSPSKMQSGDASHTRSRFRCHPWSRCPPEKRYSFDDPKRNDGATPSASRLMGSPGPLLAGPQGRVSTKRRT